MERRRGYWWAPDGDRLLACRVDDRPLPTWHIALADRSPAAAARHALSAGRHRERDRDAARAGARRVAGRRRRGIARRSSTSRRSPGPQEGPPLALVQSRDQRDMQVLAIDPDTGRDRGRAGQDHDDDLDAPHARRARVAPRRPAAHGGASRRHADAPDRRRARDARRPPGRLGARRGRATSCSARPRNRPRCTCGGWRRRVARALSDRRRRARRRRGAATSRSWSSETTRRRCPTGDAACEAASPSTRSNGSPRRRCSGRADVRLARTEGAAHRAAHPGRRRADGARFPVLLDPYGGPHFGRVVRTRNACTWNRSGSPTRVSWCSSIDGRGTPYRGVAWDQSVHRRLHRCWRSRTRWRRCTPRPSAIPSWTLTEWRSADGPTAGT